mmetsp:Transcript_6313/g.21660  ORF Transcript_6313/g.21660 Transcript_6313/m.21660 type:complete len:223 (+) Transcript_6313:651-1319(+)
MALSLFLSWVLCSVQKILIPLGLCVRCTAVSTLFTFCPPAPPLLAVVISQSLGSTLTSTSSTSGITATVAVLVWTRPLLSVAGTRCTLWTPASNLSLLKTWSPFTSNTPSFTPPLSASFRLTTETFQPTFSQYIWYIRMRSPAQMQASSPPVPALISSMMFFSSRSSFGSSSSRSLSSSSDISCPKAAASSLASSAISASPSASLIISLASLKSDSRSLYRR